MTEEEKRPQREKDLKRIKKFRLIDDDFMTVVFRNNIRDTEMILKIFMQRQDLRVTSVITQSTLKNLNGRSVTLDVHAVDSNGKQYDIEIQRKKSGAGLKRARHNSALLDASILQPREDPKILPETYVIFITEKDFFKKGKPFYPIDRYVKIDNTLKRVNDGSHILYVNGQYRKNNPIGRLMHDFFCTRPDDMVNKNLRETVRFYKENEKGVETMCEIMEEVRKEGYEKGYEKAIMVLIKSGEFSLEKIASLYEVPLERVQEIALSVKKA